MNPTIPATAGFNDKIASGIFSGLKKIPFLKGKLSTPKGEKVTKKVINIAIELFKAVGIIAAGAIFGALVGVSFGGPIPLAIATVVGGLGSGIAYFATKGVLAVIVKYAYPSNRYLKEKAISLDKWLDYNNTKAFNETIESFKNEAWFKSWMTLKGYKKCNNFLWRRFQRGFCHGEAQALLAMIKLSPKADSKTLLENMSAKRVFKYQIQEIIRADFTSILEKDKSSQIKGLKRRQLKRHLAQLAKETITVSGMKKYPPCHFDRKNLLVYSEFKRHFKDYRDQIKDKHPEFAGTIRIERRNKAHTIFIQCKKGHYRIYDGYNARRTGFYEFPDKTSFYKGLHSHLRAYARVPSIRCNKYNSASLQLYGF